MKSMFLASLCAAFIMPAAAHAYTALLINPPQAPAQSSGSGSGAWNPGNGIITGSFGDGAYSRSGPRRKHTCISNSDQRAMDQVTNAGKKYGAGLYAKFLVDLTRREGAAPTSSRAPEHVDDQIATGNVTLSNGLTCEIFVMRSTGEVKSKMPARGEARCGLEGEMKQRRFEKFYGTFGYIDYDKSFNVHAGGTGKCPFDD